MLLTNREPSLNNTNRMYGIARMKKCCYIYVATTINHKVLLIFRDTIDWLTYKLSAH